MIEFSRFHQEQKLADKREKSFQQLTEDEVDLEVYLTITQIYKIPSVKSQLLLR